MTGTVEYKCPACGGAMEFDSATQKMKCPFCGTELEVEEFLRLQEQEEAKRAETSGVSELSEPAEVKAGESAQKPEEQKSWESEKEGWSPEEAEQICVYICQSCGGEIVAEATTGAMSCPFCGNHVTVRGKFEQDAKPDYVIPFKKNKQEAKAAYRKHLERKPFLPKVFSKENHIDEIRGLYVPFWIFDTQAEGDISYEGEKIRKWRIGDIEYTEHELYQIQRSGRIEFRHIPADASRKMEDTLMESIEPYEFSEAVPFELAYLAGYVADRYDVERKECEKRAKERVKASVEREFAATVEGYLAVSCIDSWLDVSKGRYWYTLYPVWMLNTTWKGKQYTFAMNGQTGKFVGDLPMDKKAFWMFVLPCGLILSVVIYAIVWLLSML